MDEGGKHRKRESLFRHGDILDCVWHMNTTSRTPSTSLDLSQWTYGVPKHLNTYANDITLLLTKMTKLDCHALTGEQRELRMHKAGYTYVKTHVRRTKVGIHRERAKDEAILCHWQGGWWIWWINHPLNLIRTSLTKPYGMEAYSKVEGKEEEEAGS